MLEDEIKVTCQDGAACGCPKGGFSLSRLPVDLLPSQEEREIDPFVDQFAAESAVLQIDISTYHDDFPNKDPTWALPCCVSRDLQPFILVPTVRR